jgi:transposase
MALNGCENPKYQGLGALHCGRYVTTCPQEVHPDCHATWRLMRLFSSWASVATNSEVAAMFEISDATVRRYDKIVLKADTPPPCFDGLRKLLIDEKSVRKGHCYVTIILNGETGELLHMQEGRKKESGESFFEQLTEEQRAGIVTVGIDRSGVYQAAVDAWLPNADIVHDRFHLVVNVNQAVDEVRRTQCRKASKEDRQPSEKLCGFVKHGLTSGLIDGFNNLIARMVHKACGYRDLDLLELKLHHRSVMR